MKRYFYILSVWCSVLVTLCGCEQNIYPESEENREVDIPIPAEGYIFFSSGMPKTRGAEVESGPLAADFSVIGYRYPASWEAIKSQAKQNLRISYTNNNGNVVSEQTTNADNHVGVFGIDHANNPNYVTAIPGVQRVAYNNGIHSYAPLQSWQKNLNYAFYAWYPADLVANGGNNQYEGAPYITYTLPDGVNREARRNMIDVLTACEIDYAKRDGMTVSLSMNHRLAALDVRVNSLITARALKETYESDFGSVSDNTPVTVDVTDFSLTLNGIYTTAQIPLNDRDDAEEKITASGRVNRTYTGFQGITGLTERNTTSIVGDDEMLILIPQSTPVEVALQISYIVRCGNRTKNFTVSSSEQGIDITIDELEGGMFHYLTLTLTKSGLFVQAQKAVSWEDGPDVEHKFE